MIDAIGKGCAIVMAFALMVGGANAVAGAGGACFAAGLFIFLIILATAGK